MRLRKLFLALASAIGVGLLVSAAAQGTASPDVLAALLIEVRGLRSAMEQIASAGPRVQLALGRLQLQEQRLSTMIRRAESLHDSVVSAEKAQADLQGQLSNVERQLKSADLPPEDRDQISSHVPGMRRRLGAAALEVQRLQGEETAMQQQIAGEQARWADINRTLEDLERALGRR